MNSFNFLEGRFPSRVQVVEVEKGSIQPHLDLAGTGRRRCGGHRVVGVFHGFDN